MGCCVSKCRPKKRSSEEYRDDAHSHTPVEDKLVISQASKTHKILIPASNKISPAPLSPTTSTSSSASSFTGTNSNSTSTTISSCSSHSTGSSILSSKDRSFSNEFLWSCVKENPHIIRINSIKECSQSRNAHAPKPGSPAKQIMPAAPLIRKQLIPQKVNGSTPQKRVRSNSPTTLTRQKSFRREPDRFNHSHSLPTCSRSLRSPSPSRRFNIGDSGRGTLTTTQPKESCSNPMFGVKRNSTLRKESLGLASPYINSSELRSCLRNRETCIHRITSKIDQVAVQEALAHQDSDSVPMEDIDNPLISLDCFIFL